MAHTAGFMQYESQHPLYGLGFSHSPQHPFRTALTTLVSGPSNKLVIIDQINGGKQLQQIASISLGFPATKVGWEPASSLMSHAYADGNDRAELLATTGDVLRIWDLTPNWEGNGSGFVGRNQHQYQDHILNTRSVLTNSKSPQQGLPPITSFAWSPVSPEKIATCSIDTTATLWDISTNQAVTQLIAHDRAVYDLAWLPQSSDIFVSVGADGSLRAFDLRQLEHSTILYESANGTPLARIGFSNTEQHMLACFSLNDSKTLILDMRSPGQPVAELMGHQAPVSAISWGAGGSEGSGGGWVASCGDDCQLLLYDLTGPLPTSSQSKAQTKAASPSYALSPPATPSGTNRSPSPARAVEILPSRAWTAESEINNLAFTDNGDWVGAVHGQKLSVLQVA